MHWSNEEVLLILDLADRISPTELILNLDCCARKKYGNEGMLVKLDVLDRSGENRNRAFRHTS